MKIGEADCSILKSQLEKLKMEYQDYCKMGLHLNISRGLPCKEQLDLNGAMFHLPDEKNYQAEDGTDCRNYVRNMYTFLCFFAECTRCGRDLHSSHCYTE